ncbi:MAG: DUF424 domain-containing protein [Thermodesulfobacteriota bacterium]|nr:MAG: DUF424 domain-containing protein [Thermodesulfobacteriota bacterium]
MLVKIHKSYRYVVAICDSDLLGKKFEEGKFQLNIKESFFNGEEKFKEEVLEIMHDLIKEDATFYIIGKESVNTAIEAGIISKEGVKEIMEIPFALILL